MKLNVTIIILANFVIISSNKHLKNKKEFKSYIIIPKMIYLSINLTSQVHVKFSIR